MCSRYPVAPHSLLQAAPPLLLQPPDPHPPNPRDGQPPSQTAYRLFAWPADCEQLSGLHITRRNVYPWSISECGANNYRKANCLYPAVHRKRSPNGQCKWKRTESLTHPQIPTYTLPHDHTQSEGTPPEKRTECVKLKVPALRSSQLRAQSPNLWGILVRPVQCGVTHSLCYGVWDTRSQWYLVGFLTIIVVWCGVVWGLFVSLQDTHLLCKPV